jgi:toxin FitB
MIVLDTNVISEALRPIPDPTVLSWLSAVHSPELWTTTIVVAELFSGLDKMPVGRRQKDLREKMEILAKNLFAGRILSFDPPAAYRYGSILANRYASGRPINSLDTQIAAIASVHNAALATRNTRDFEQCGIKLINP